jgi:hypothetical protein
MSTPKALLERYVEAKDLVRPQLMPEIYAPDAVLTFSIETSSIAFPARVPGLESITKTLVVDLAARFSRFKTFCVCDEPPGEHDDVAVIPWLVLMRETAASCLRAGRGYYEWTFGGEPRRVRAMHIHIDRMEPVEDPEGRLLSAAQSGLPYPWLPPASMRSRFDSLIASDPAFAFLRGLRTPVTLPSTPARR